MSLISLRCATRLFVLRNYIGEAVLRRMSDRQRPSSDSKLFSQKCGFVMKDDFRPAAGRRRDFNVEPAHRCSPAAPEGFHDRFLGGETAGVAFIAAAQLVFAILNLFPCKHPVTKAFANPQIFQSSADPFNFDHVDTDAKNHIITLTSRGSECQRPFHIDCRVLLA
jgi:hypothetical protein